MNNAIRNRAVVIILIAAMVFAYMPTGIWENEFSAYALDKPWDGEYLQDPDEAMEIIESLSYDEEGYLLIETAEQLAAFAVVINNEYLNEADVRLTRCIDLGSHEWTPIGADGSSYSGTFDGCGHTVSNMKITNEECHSYLGLFGEIGASKATVIKNLTVSGVIEDDGVASDIGGIVGVAKRTSFENCRSDVQISSYSADATGGIAGLVSSGSTSLTNCANGGNVSSYNGSAGGIIGKAALGTSYNLTISSCYNTGDITAVEGEYAGGIIGSGKNDYEQSAATLKFSGGLYNTGIIKGQNGFDGYEFVGVFLYKNLSNNGDWYCQGTKYSYGTIVSKYYVEESESDFLLWNDDAYKKTDDYIILIWEYENLSHKDEGAATTEEKDKALAELDTYKSRENYYDQQWQEIEAIIEQAKEDCMADDTLKLSDVNSIIEKAKVNIDNVRDKHWMDEINSGINSIEAIVADKEESNYDSEDWDIITDVADKAKNDVRMVTSLEAIAGIVEAARTAIDNVMTQKDKAELSELREDAAKEMELYINAVKEEFNNSLYLLDNKENAKATLEEKQKLIAEAYFEPWLEGGSKVSELESMTTKAEINAWVAEGKEAVEVGKKGGVLNRISNAEELIAFAEAVNNNKANGECFAILTDDIDLTAVTEWKPIGSSTSYAYKGTFLGNGKTVKVNIATAASNRGIFGYVDGAYISDLIVEGGISMNSTGSSYGTSALVAYVNNSSESTTTIENCVNKANINGGTYAKNVGAMVGYVKGTGTSYLRIINCRNEGALQGSTYVGGLIGYVNNAVNIRMENCSNSGVICGSSAAGIVSYVANANAAITITDCRNTGNITENGIYGGGIVAYSNGKSDIESCSNSGTVVYSSGTSGSGTGGIIGYSAKGTIRKCSNGGAVKGFKYVGGIAGNSVASEITLCANTGAVSTNGSFNWQYVGGIAGCYSAAGKISYVYNTGAVEGDRYGYNIGGISGSVLYNSATPQNVYNTGEIVYEGRTDSYASLKGAISCTSAAAMNVSDVYYALENTCDTLIGVRGTAVEDSQLSGFKTEAEMKTEGFVDLLNCNLEAEGEGFVMSRGGANNGYPLFQWQLDEIEKELQARKDAAIAEITSEFDPENYYSPQSEQIAHALNQAIEDISSVKDSIQQVDTTKAQWQESLRGYLDKIQINLKLNSEKEKSCQILDKYMDFSGYGEESTRLLESLESSLQLAVDNGKSDVNKVTPEEYAEDMDVVFKKQQECERVINSLYMSKGLWNGNEVNDSCKPEQDDGVWQISNAAELTWFMQQVNTNYSPSFSHNACLLDDIDLGGHLWNPIGVSSNSSSGYNGTFEGNGKTISGLYVDMSEGYVNGGLFGQASSYSKIQNLTVEGSIVGTGSREYTSYEYNAGGIAGNSGGKIFNCVANVDICVAQVMYAGGVAGNANYAAYCTNLGSVSISDTTAKGIGGIAGNISNKGLILFSINEGNVTASMCSAGGIAGSMNSSSNSASRIRNCYNTGIVSAGTGYTWPAGGIVGYATGDGEQITNVYNAGTVIEGSGIIGRMGDSKSIKDGMKVVNAYNIGEVSYGQIVGELYNGSVVNCYASTGNISYSTSTEGYTHMEKCLILEEEMLKGYAEILGTAFEDDMENINGGYPVLAFVKDDMQIREAKMEAIDEIITLAGNPNNSTKYGNQISALLEVANDGQIEVENASTLEEVLQAKNDAILAIASVKTQLQVERGMALHNLMTVVEGKVYSKANDLTIENLLAEAEAALEKCQSSQSISETESEYAEKLNNISTYDEDSKAELTDEKNKIEETNNLSLVKAKELEALLIKACGEINSVAERRKQEEIDPDEARKEIDDIFGWAKAEMMELTSGETSLTDVNISEEDPLKKEKDMALKEIIDAISPGMEEDYRDEEWQDIKNIWDESAAGIRNAESDTEIESIKSEAIDVINKIMTEEEILSDKRILDEKKKVCKESIESLLRRVNLLSGENKELALNIIEKGCADMDAVSLKNMSLDDAIAQVEEICLKCIENIEVLLESLQENSWAESVREPERNAEGTCLISEAEELAWLAQAVNSGEGDIDAVLTADIDLSGKRWVPIGVGYTYNSDEKTQTTYKYTGTFDGQGHRVDNMYLYDNDGPIGLFGQVDRAEIKNLTVAGLITSKGSTAASYKVYAGAIAGIADNSVISNCRGEADIKSAVQLPSTSSLAELNIGGIAGKASGKTLIDKCLYKGEIDAEYCRAIGGIVGDASSASATLTVSQCANLGNISYKNRYTYILGSGQDVAVYGCGGIMGIADSSNVRITHCYNGGTISGNEKVGGILGYVPATSASGNSTEIEKSYNYGDVSAITAYRGGITGWAEGGKFDSDIYMLKGSASKAMGLIITGNNINITEEKELKSDNVLDALNGEEKVFTASIAGLNSGYPIFCWQLTEKDSKREISAYLNEFIPKEDFTDEQWQQVEEILAEASKNIEEGEEYTYILNAYKNTIEKLQGVSAAMREEIASNLRDIQAGEYDAKLEKEIGRFIEGKANEITEQDLTPKKALEIFDEARANIVDMLIDNIPDTIDAGSAESISAAREGYEDLNDAQKQSVTRYMRLTSAESTYASDSSKAETAINLINVIGNVNKNSGAVIKAARNAYEKLTDAQKTYVSNQQLSVLETAEKRLAEILAQQDKEESTEQSTTTEKGENISQSGDYFEDWNAGESLEKDADIKIDQDAAAVSSGSVFREEGKQEASSIGFDWTILPIGLGIVVLLAVAFLIIRWFGAASRRKKN